MDDPPEFGGFYGRPASHISPSHYPRGPELPQHSIYAPHSFHDYDLRQPHHHTVWGGVDPHTIASDSYATYGTHVGSSFPEAPRLTPPPAPAITNNQRLSLSGSLDPTTGIFYRTPEHPRLRTAQACEKCRTRKAKCSGEHPACQRCITRGLACEYAKEGRVRGPNRVKSKPSVSSVSDSRRASLAAEDSGRKSESSSGAPSAPSSSPEKSSLQQSPPSNVTIPAERTKSSRPKPPHLRLDIESNHFQREIAAEQASLVQAEVLHRERSNSQPFAVFDEHGNHAPVYWPQEHGVDHDIAVGGSHLQTNTPPRDGEVEVGQMNYLLQQPFHPAMLELHHPVATIPAQLNMEPGQYQHTQNRSSISSLTYSAASASSVSSPVTPSSATYTERDSGGQMGVNAEFQFFLGYSGIERQHQQGFESAWSDPDQMHSTPTVEASHKLSLAAEGAWSDGIDYPMETYQREHLEIDPAENIAHQPLHYSQQ